LRKLDWLNKSSYLSAESDRIYSVWFQ